MHNMTWVCLKWNTAGTNKKVNWLITKNMFENGAYHKWQSNGENDSKPWGFLGYPEMPYFHAKLHIGMQGGVILRGD